MDFYNIEFIEFNTIIYDFPAELYHPKIFYRPVVKCTIPDMISPQPISCPRHLCGQTSNVLLKYTGMQKMYRMHGMYWNTWNVQECMEFTGMYEI